jgi:NAD-dependent dihydropyrimidine dehydrogenase PreA subunit
LEAAELAASGIFAFLRAFSSCSAAVRAALESRSRCAMIAPRAKRRATERNSLARYASDQNSNSNIEVPERIAMAHVITEPCIGTKDTKCVEACPVNCIHPMPGEAGFDTATQLYIDPEACIDCGLCVDECPVQAIFPQDDVPAEWKKYIQINADHFKRS